ncbi:MAG: TIGR02996 domain-containing protein [Deltaproteobacteria bacterium]|nr:TIGR02996 domain-containing protein [Deltaproteobacteria bacterium]
MTKNAAELFAAVYASPDDDGPRSVLADLLQEQGDPRGEFIALQLAREEDPARESAAEAEHAEVARAARHGDSQQGAGVRPRLRREVPAATPRGVDRAVPRPPGMGHGERGPARALGQNLPAARGCVAVAAGPDHRRPRTRRAASFASATREDRSRVRVRGSQAPREALAAVATRVGDRELPRDAFADEAVLESSGGAPAAVAQSVRPRGMDPVARRARVRARRCTGDDEPVECDVRR